MISPQSAHRAEAVALPALNLLGHRGQHVLVLGSGTAQLAWLILRMPFVQRLVIVDGDEKVLNATRLYFGRFAAAFDDERTQLVIDDPLQWLRHSTGRYDAIFLAWWDQPWRKPGPQTRVPRTREFFLALRGMLTPHGILVQEIGSMANMRRVLSMITLHRTVFAATWPLMFADLEGLDLEDDQPSRFDRNPCFLALSSADAGLHPLAVNWTLWHDIALEDLHIYHPMLHKAMFVLPAELQRQLDAPTPHRPSLATAGASMPKNNEDNGLAAVQVATFSLEAKDCDTLSLNNAAHLRSLLSGMAELAGLTPLSNLTHSFEPQGVTALLLVSESHLSVHTWPEWQYAALDVVSCKSLSNTILMHLEATVRSMLHCSTVMGHLTLRALHATKLGQGRHATPSEQLRHMEL